MTSYDVRVVTPHSLRGHALDKRRGEKTRLTTTTFRLTAQSVCINSLCGINLQSIGRSSGGGEEDFQVNNVLDMEMYRKKQNHQNIFHTCGIIISKDIQFSAHCELDSRPLFPGRP